MSNDLFAILQRTISLQTQLNATKEVIPTVAKRHGIELPENAEYGFLTNVHWAVGRQELKYKKVLDSHETFSHAMVVHRVERQDNLALIIGCTDDDYETPLVMVAYQAQEVNWDQL